MYFKRVLKAIMLLGDLATIRAIHHHALARSAGMVDMKGTDILLVLWPSRRRIGRVAVTSGPGERGQSASSSCDVRSLLRLALP